MVTLKGAILLIVVSATQAATFLAVDKKASNAAKRQADAYKYSLPVITFPDSNPQKIYVETIKSLTSGQRYLPPSGPTASSNTPSLKPISVSYNAFEAPGQSPQPTAQSVTPKASPTPTATASPAPVSVTVTAAPVKKRPSGGLGGFKYYGGAGSSSSSSGSKTEISNVAALPASTAVPAPIVPAVVAKPVQEIVPIEKPQQRPVFKNPGFDYPSPKPNRKPSKKEQRLIDSKPEETGTGYQYEVGLPSSLSVASGDVVNAVSDVASVGASMGGSYMRQSSPFYNFHIMLD